MAGPRILLAPLAACLLALAAAGPDERPCWPLFRGDAALSGVAPGTLPADLALLWSFETGGAITSSPAIAGGRAYFGSDDGKLYAVRLSDGAQVWSFETGDMIEAPPLVHDGVVYVGSSDFFLYALDAETGALVWKSETGDKILGGANAVRGPGGESRVVVGSYDNQLYCFDAKTGERVWTYATDNYVNGTPAVLGDRIVFGGCDAALHVVSAATGEGLAKIELGPECHVAGSVALADGRVYFGHYGNEFACWDLASGAKVWGYGDGRQAFFSSPAIGADRVIFGGRDKKLHCVKKSDGTPLWTFPTRRKVDGSPVLVGDRVVFGSGDGRLYVLAAEDGEELWSYDLGKSIFSSPAVCDGTIAVGCADGRLYAFGAKKQEPGG